MASNPLDYFIGKGIVSWTPSGGTIRDLGNVPTFEMTPALERLDHFSARTGIRSKDRSIVVEKTMQLRLVLDEWNVDNLAMALMSTPVTAVGPPEVTTIDIFADSALAGAISFQGTNEVGAKYDILLPNVSLIPAGTLGWITDEYGQIELTGDILVDGTGSFGTVTLAAAGA